MIDPRDVGAAAAAVLRTGVAEQVTATVESLIGRPPRDFAAFARDHAGLLAPMAEGAGR